METFDVVVVGAGMAGLSAAYYIHQKNPALSLRVLEANQRVGGRAKSVLLKTTSGMDRFDIGGQWIGVTQTYLKDLLDELGIEVYPQYTTGKKVLQLGDHPPTTYSSSLPSFSSVMAYADFIQAMLRTELMINRIDPEDPFARTDSAMLDSLSTKALIDRFAFTDENRLAFEIAVRVVFGARPEQISALGFLAYAGTGGSFENLIDTQNDGAQSGRIKDTAGNVAQRLCDQLGPGVVEIGQPVVAISEVESDPPGSGGLIVQTADGAKRRAKRVIVAIPPAHLQNIYFSPPLPYAKRELCKSFPMGNLIKFIVTYETAFWREGGFSGELVSFTTKGQPENRPNPVIVTYDATTSNWNPALVGFIPNEWGDVTGDERRHAVVHDLARLLGPQAKHFLDYTDMDWSQEPYVGGCPTAVLPPGQMAHYIDHIRRPVGAVHWAGTETATHWMGYLSGAVQSGHRFVHDVI